MTPEPVGAGAVGTAWPRRKGCAPSNAPSAADPASLRKPRLIGIGIGVSIRPPAPAPFVSRSHADGGHQNDTNHDRRIQETGAFMPISISPSFAGYAAGGEESVRFVGRRSKEGIRITGLPV